MKSKLAHYLIPIFLGCNSLAGQPDAPVIDRKGPVTIVGTVVAAVWKTGGHSTRMALGENDNSVETGFTYRDSWFIILKDVVGIDLATVKSMSLGFVAGEPSDSLWSEYDRSSKSLCIRIEGSKTLKLKMGGKVRLLDCRYTLDQVGAIMSYSKIELP